MQWTGSVTIKSETIGYRTNGESSSVQKCCVVPTVHVGASDLLLATRSLFFKSELVPAVYGLEVAVVGMEVGRRGMRDRAHEGQNPLRHENTATREREARKGRNPRTGETVDVPAKRVPYFKPGKDMRRRLNDD